MAESLLDECREAILKMAATQAPEGERAILVMAETFWANSGRTCCDDQPSSPQDFPAGASPLPGCGAKSG
jgi:hypothetical protein